jgi:hypothetical protein
VKLLTIDFDYFFPMPHDDVMEFVTYYDWGHSESWGGDFGDMMWFTRASTFYRGGKELPQVTDEWRTFAERFTFNEEYGATLIVANSHVYGAADGYGELWRPGEIDEVWLFDAHHDSGYGHGYGVGKSDNITCENWLAYFTNHGAETHVRYPRWHTSWHDVDREPDVPPTSRTIDIGTNKIGVEFDVVMLARSDAWVPPWCDAAWSAFVDSFVDATGADEIMSADDSYREIRPFDYQAAKNDADAVADFMRRAR